MIEYVDIIQPDTFGYDVWVKFTEEGDSLKITPSTPVLGISSIKSCTLETTHEFGSSLDVLFRYSVDDGLNWSLWADLNNANLKTIITKKNQFFCIEINLIKRGPGTSYFKSLDFQFAYEEPAVPEVYKTLNFSDKCPYWNHTSITWALNVLKKSYKRGVVPSFIERTEDYVHLWWSLIYPSALRLAWAEVFTDLLWYKDILRNYLESRGLIVGKTSNLAELHHLMNNFYDEIAKRGTLSVFDVSRESDNSTGVRGELLRLVDADETDECVVGVINSEEQGWVLGYSSPCGYQNTDYLINFRKGYENELSDLSFYPLLEPNKVSLSNGKIIINSTNGFAGIGQENDSSKSIAVSPLCNYWIVVKFTLNQLSKVRFGCVGFDSLGNVIPFDRPKVNEGIGYWTIGSNFIVAEGTNFFVEGDFEPGEYLFIGEIRDGAKNYAVQMSDFSTSWVFPKNKDLSSIYPIFHVEGVAQISDFHIQLISDKDMYLSITKEVSLLLTNNSSYTEEQIREISERSLLPINLQYSLKLI